MTPYSERIAEGVAASGETIQNTALRQRESRDLIESMLRRRGIHAVKYAAADASRLPETEASHAEHVLYGLMKKYSFRIFLRDLAASLPEIDMALLTRYCSENTAKEYLATLLEQQLLQKVAPGQYALTNPQMQTVGDTFEWFVAQVLQREFDCPAEYGIRFKHSGVGGDYDVIASVEGHLAYIEVKSSPPKHIEYPEIHAFFERVSEFRPQIAIFLEDTHLRMRDKLVPMFEEALRQQFGNHADSDYPLRELHDEVFVVNNIVFLANTKPDLISNLGVCLKHFLDSCSAWPLA
ncbi:hypothetical protein U14_02485 [Candidatus Moduliflexus flocculans]|uniref:Uncharacterized protein n=1 Tax=Candidatus Moduliflexus flocculans TaxID=1499966 RepID=A0A081BLH6_9BACT|nr:hypothetical protein U14_02485 [Candidatus Moduliflexus flocculans]